MYISLSQQFSAFFYSTLLGFALGVVYDLFRVLRLFGLKSAVAVFIEDIVFWLVCMISTFIFTLIYNNGELRLYIILFEIIGFLIQHFTIGNAVFKLLKCSFNALRNFLGKIHKKLSKIGKKELKNVKKPLQNREEM